MTRPLLLLVWLFVAGPSDAFTAAWKAPLGDYVGDLGTDERVKKLEKPPGKSAFFQPGDELWDLSKSLRWVRKIEEENQDGDPFEEQAWTAEAFKWEGDWIVWNARSKLVIASGSWMDIRNAEEALDYRGLPTVIRTRFELLTSEEGKLQRSLSLVSRSGERAKAQMEGQNLEIECISDSGGEWVDLRLGMTWPASFPEQTWTVNTGVTVKVGQRVLIARQGLAEEKWQLFATAGVEMIDGTPQSKTRWLEEPEGIVVWPREGSAEQPVRKVLGNGLHIGIFQVPRDMVQRLDPEAKEAAALVEPPLQATEWVRGPLSDVRKLLAGHGVKIEGEGSFAGFSASGCLVVIADKENLDLVEELISGGCCNPARNARVETNVEAGGWSLTARSGEKAEIARSRSGVTDCLFSIEPTLAGADDLVDLRYKIDVVNGIKVLGRSESASTLGMGFPQKVGSFSPDGAPTTDLILTVRPDEAP